MSEGYAWEKTYGAASVLACGSGPLRQRLADAYWYHLSVLRDEDIPWPDLRRQFATICNELTRSGGSLREALAARPDDDVRLIAQEIVDLFGRVAQRQRK